jgi:hypothetical protein
MTLIKTLATATLLLTGTLVMPAMADTAKPGKPGVPAAVADVDKPDSIAELLFGPKKSPETAAVEKPVTSSPKGVPSTTLRSRIAAHALAAGLPTELAEAVVRHESRFNPRLAVVTANRPHADQAADGAWPGYSGSAAGLYDVETNLKWGMAYLPAPTSWLVATPAAPFSATTPAMARRA